MNIHFIGGSDAGGWYIGADGKIHRIPGWNPEAMTELTRAVEIINAAGRLKTPGLGDATIKGVMQFVQNELSTHVKEGGVLVIR